MDSDTRIGAMKLTVVSRRILFDSSAFPNKPTTPRQIDVLHGHKHLQQMAPKPVDKHSSLEYEAQETRMHRSSIRGDRRVFGLECQSILGT